MEKDSVKVFLRLRPSSKKEAKNLNLNYIDQKKSTDRMIVINETPFTFHHIFYSSSTQDEVFQTMVSRFKFIYELVWILSGSYLDLLDLLRWSHR